MSPILITVHHIADHYRHQTYEHNSKDKCHHGVFSSRKINVPAQEKANPAGRGLFGKALYSGRAQP
jgi:hypothetical protein